MRMNNKKIKDVEVTDVSDFQSILQKLHIEIDPGAYLEDIEMFNQRTVSQNIIKEEEESEAKTEP